MLIMILLFKQKPAYEMGISDWSLDVCSSDLQAKKALDVIAKNMDRQVKRGKIGEAEKQAALKRISSGTGLEMFADSDIVIEAASENEEINRAIFKTLCPQLKPSALLCPNTSSLSIPRLAAAPDRPATFTGTRKSLREGQMGS